MDHNDNNIPLDPKLLKTLVCPLSRTPLEYNANTHELISRTAKLGYPIRNGIPVMIPDEARKIS